MLQVLSKIPKISLFLPGSKIPEWFNYQSSGSSMTIELPQHWCNRRFIGFALSAIIAFGEKYEDIDWFRVSCNYRFEDSYGDSVCFRWHCSLHICHAKLNDHIILGYSPCMDARLLKGNYTTVKFTFGASKSSCLCKPLKDCQLKCCGVYPLFAQPNNCVERLTTTTTSGSSISIDEGEPDPKRICRNQTDTL